MIYLPILNKDPNLVMILVEVLHKSQRNSGYMVNLVMMSVIWLAIHSEDRFCTSKKGGIGEGMWV